MRACTAATALANSFRSCLKRDSSSSSAVSPPSANSTLCFCVVFQASFESELLLCITGLCSIITVCTLLGRIKHKVMFKPFSCFNVFSRCFYFKSKLWTWNFESLKLVSRSWRVELECAFAAPLSGHRGFQFSCVCCLCFVLLPDGWRTKHGRSCYGFV